jgi:hypothetical protein
MSDDIWGFKRHGAYYYTIDDSDWMVGTVIPFKFPKENIESAAIQTPIGLMRVNNPRLKVLAEIPPPPTLFGSPLMAA